MNDAAYLFLNSGNTTPRNSYSIKGACENCNRPSTLSTEREREILELIQELRRPVLLIPGWPFALLYTRREWRVQPRGRGGGPDVEQKRSPPPSLPSQIYRECPFSHRPRGSIIHSVIRKWSCDFIITLYPCCSKKYYSKKLLNNLFYVKAFGLQ